MKYIRYFLEIVTISLIKKLLYPKISLFVSFYCIFFNLFCSSRKFFYFSKIYFYKFSLSVCFSLIFASIFLIFFSTLFLYYNHCIIIGYNTGIFYASWFIFIHSGIHILRISIQLLHLISVFAIVPRTAFIIFRGIFIFFLYWS